MQSSQVTAPLWMVPIEAVKQCKQQHWSFRYPLTLYFCIIFLHLEIFLSIFNVLFSQNLAFMKLSRHWGPKKNNLALPPAAGFSDLAGWSRFSNLKVKLKAWMKLILVTNAENNVQPNVCHWGVYIDWDNFCVCSHEWLNNK